MPDTNDFFSDYLPQKLINEPNLQDIGKTFRFVIDGAGTWTLNLAELNLSEGDDGDADCTITTDKSTWEQMLGNPSAAISLFMMGKLKVDNIGLATQLQKILG